MPVLINFDSKQLDKKWKHARDFGVAGNRNKVNLILYQKALEDHVENLLTEETIGTYRGISVYHYFNPYTKLWLCIDMNRNFMCGWKLDPLQEFNLIVNGKVK
jgi:Colicin D